MAEVFQRLKFDDREIEKSMKLMLRGMDDVRKKAKEVSVYLENEFLKAQKQNVRKVQSLSNDLKQGFLAPLQFLSVASLAAGVTQLGIEGAKSALELEKLYFQIENITSASKENVELYKSAIPGLSLQVGILQTELVKALYQINSAGISGKQALDVLELSAKAAAVGLGDANTVAKTLTTIINAYGKENITAARASAALFQAVKQGSGDVNQIAPAFSKATTLAAEFNIEIEQISAALSQLTNKGVDASEAITQIQSIMVALLKPTAEGQKRLAEVNLSYEELRKLAGIDLSKALQLVREKFEGNNEAIGDILGRSESLQGFFALTGENAKDLTKILQDAKKGSDDLLNSFENLNETTGQKWKRIWTTTKEAFSIGAGYVIDVLAWMEDRWSIFLTGIDSKTRRQLEIAKKLNLETANKNAPENPLFTPTELSTKDKPIFFDSQDEFNAAAEEALRTRVKLTEEEQKKVAALGEEYKKLLLEFKKKTEDARIENLPDPFEKLNAIKNQGLAEIENIRKAIVDKAKEAGRPIPEDLAQNIKILTEGVEAQYREALIELINEMRSVEVTELTTDRQHLDGIIARELHNAFKIPDSLMKEAQNAGIVLSNIAGFIFTDKEGEDALQKGLDRNERDFISKMKKHVDNTKAASDKILKERAEKEDQEGKGSFFARLLGVSENEFKDISRAFGQAFFEINNLIAQGTQNQIDENNRLIDSIRGRLSAAEEALRKEEELQRQGSANNVATKKREVEALKAQELKALKEKADLQKRLARQQLIADSLQQASSLATAVADIFKANAKFPIVGIITAVASIASMLALFARFKSQVRAATAETTRAHKGGPITEYVTGWVNPETGRTDRFGGRGHRIEDSSLVVGGKEFIVNEETAARQAAFLEDLNSGKYDGINIKQLVQSRMRLNDLLEERPVRYDSMKTVKELRRLEKKVEKRRTSELVTKKELQKMFEDQSKSIRKAILEERPEYIPWQNDTIGYIRKTPFLSERIRLDKTGKESRETPDK